jgi:hypothetical protein
MSKGSPFQTRVSNLSGLSPLKQDVVNKDDYTHIPMDSLIARQQFAESRFKSGAVSEDGAISVAQIMPDTFKDGLKKGYVPKGTKYKDLAKDDKLATKFQENYMQDLLTRDWNELGVKSADEKIQRAKALAAYNMGPTGLVNYLNKQKERGVNIYSSLDWVEGLNTETKDYVKNIMLGGDEGYEREFGQEFEHFGGSSLKKSGLSPFRDNDDIDLSKSKVKIDPLEEEINAGRFSKTISDLVDYWSQEEGEGKLHSRLKGEEITKHKPYEQKQTRPNIGVVSAESKRKSYDRERTWKRPYLDPKETADKVVDRLMNTQVLQIENEEEARETLEFMKRIEAKEVDLKDPSVIRRIQSIFSQEYKLGARAVGSYTTDPKVKLSPSQAQNHMYDFKEASGEELYNRLKDIVAHELGHITLGSGTEPKEGTTIDLDRLYKGKSHKGIGTTWKDMDSAGLATDEYYGQDVGAMSTKDAEIIEGIMRDSDTAKNMGVDFSAEGGMSKEDKHNMSFQEAYADMQSFRTDALDRGIYDWRTEDLDRETLQRYIDSYKGETIPFGVRRFLKKFTVQPYGDEDYNEPAKYDNIIYMNNVIARGDVEGGQNIGGGVAAQMNPDNYKAS